MYKLLYTKQAKKDAKKLSERNLKKKAQEILKIIEEDPFQDYPPYDKVEALGLAAFFNRSLFKKNKYPASNCL